MFYTTTDSLAKCQEDIKDFTMRGMYVLILKCRKFIIIPISPKVIKTYFLRRIDKIIHSDEV